MGHSLLNRQAEVQGALPGSALDELGEGKLRRTAGAAFMDSE